MTKQRLGVNETVAFLILAVTSALSGCSMQRYSYMDFSQNQGLRIVEESAPTNENIWWVSKIPTKMVLEKDGQRIELSVDKNGYLPNVKIQSSYDGSKNTSRIKNVSDAGKYCMAVKQDLNNLAITLVVPENCSGHLEIESLDSQGRIAFSREIRFLVKKVGVVTMIDAI